MPPPLNANLQGEMRLDRFLTNFQQRFVQDANNFVAQRATTVVPVQNQSDKYVVYERGYFWRDDVQPRPLGGRPAQTNYKVRSETYLAEEYALEHTIDDRQRSNTQAPINQDENATILLTGKHMIKQDRVWAQKFFVPNVWATEREGDTDFTRFDDPQSDPIAVIDREKDRIGQLTGQRPNVLVMGTTVKRVLRSHPDIADRIKYTRTGIADDAILAMLFDVDRIVVPRSVYNAAEEGDDDDFQYISDPTAMLLAHIAPTPTLDAVTAMATFAWTGLIPGATNALGGVISRGRAGRAYSDYFHARMAWDQRIVSEELGVFFQGVVEDVPLTD
jgi:hypothetical protein